MLRFLDSLQFVLFVFFTAAYAYQIVYLVIGLIGKERRGKQDAKLHRYAAVISARNEEGVIGDLIRDLKGQHYPEKLLDVFVVADNCTDGTARLPARRARSCTSDSTRCRSARATRWTGCSSASLRIRANRPTTAFSYSTRIIWWTPTSFREMNKMFDTGEYAALTSYRNSKNFCDNWISAAMPCGSCAKRGSSTVRAPSLASTARFPVRASWLRRRDPRGRRLAYHLLTEDIEFSISCAVRGRKDRLLR